jgi:hypothetical protein
MSIIRGRVASLLCAGAIGLGVMFIALPSHAQQQKKGASHYVSPAGYITGVVQGEKGPEAGVWVIAETKDFQTQMIKIVVTNDQGKFMLPELPGATYKVWVRGYGLADSTPIETKPTATPVTLKVANAATPQEAAKAYPGDYWLAMMAPPAKNLFPGTGPEGNGLGRGMITQDHWINSLKSGCNFCHQLGNALTRDTKHVFAAKPELKTDTEAWEWRLGTGVRGTNMYSLLGQMGKDPTLHSLSDWTERIEKGEVPPAPPRPSGIERNVVATLWDVGDDHSFMHDQVSTDKNHPTVNGGGPSYAVNAGHGQLVVLDQADNNTYALDIPTRESKDKVPSRFPSPNRPSMFWGNEHLWSNPPYDPADPHNPMLDSKGRVWMTSKIRSNTDPSWCNDPTANKYADWFPLRGSARQASFWDPKTKQFTLIDTCYSTHHLQFDNDADETVYFNELSGPIVGWVDTKIYDQTPGTPEEKEQKAVGWCGQVLDTNGDGKITRSTDREHPFNVIQQGRVVDASILYSTDTAATGSGGGRGRGQAPAVAFDPTKDTLVSYSLYAVIPSPVDDSVWGVSESPFPGMLVRMMRGNNPPETCKTQIFEVPAPGYDPRGVDVDSNGVVWTGLAATSHLASFDVRKCKDLKGPAKTDGSQCKEGWTLYQTQGPKLKGTDVPADFHYYNWVDQHNVIGLGANTPFVTGSNSDSLIALNPQTQKWTYFRVPYPLGYYARGMDARIDDPSMGWKGRALYSNYGTHFVWHIEGGKGTKGKIVKFQLRPDPHAR